MNTGARKSVKKLKFLVKDTEGKEFKNVISFRRTAVTRPLLSLGKLIDDGFSIASTQDKKTFLEKDGRKVELVRKGSTSQVTRRCVCL